MASKVSQDANRADFWAAVVGVWFLLICFYSALAWAYLLWTHGDHIWPIAIVFDIIAAPLLITMVFASHDETG